VHWDRALAASGAAFNLHPSKLDYVEKLFALRSGR